MTPNEAVREIRECLDGNLGIDNLCVRVLLRAYDRLQTENESLREEFERLRKPPPWRVPRIPGAMLTTRSNSSQ